MQSSFVQTSAMIQMRRVGGGSGGVSNRVLQSSQLKDRTRNMETISHKTISQHIQPHSYLEGENAYTGLKFAKLNTGT